MNTTYHQVSPFKFSRGCRRHSTRIHDATQRTRTPPHVLVVSGRDARPMQTSGSAPSVAQMISSINGSRSGPNAPPQTPGTSRWQTESQPQPQSQSRSQQPRSKAPARPSSLPPERSPMEIHSTTDQSSDYGTDIVEGFTLTGLGGSPNQQIDSRFGGGPGVSPDQDQSQSLGSSPSHNFPTSKSAGYLSPGPAKHHRRPASATSPHSQSFRSTNQSQANLVQSLLKTNSHLQASVREVTGKSGCNR